MQSINPWDFLFGLDFVSRFFGVGIKCELKTLIVRGLCPGKSWAFCQLSFNPIILTGHLIFIVALAHED